ncbi:WecB/TagA/CpsF family glycosyltransferase [Anaeromyxobacter diazotrophicus]|uniref:N-acetylmannosaminyltransferase n=1 Tax=Anaeromyxobacter diazotrophicus TaxID=2590199 RepID=A0A7I9VMJ5_9BACT|nr:WecB/TagA/CpsF family glycosyltransferase [Anaeromyxobacter diazotrophicus]GEJ57626.1 N-acetylmannosaminyltransferase [Anaeromyxobacter diazotrophicus]
MTPEAPSSVPQRLEILGVPVDAVDMARAVAFADEAVRAESRPQSILAVNPEKVMSLAKDPWLAEFFRGGRLLIPDGIGVVWAAKLQHASLARVPGADLMQELCALAARRGYAIYLYGAKEEVSAAAAAHLQARHPSLRIAGRSNGYVPAERMGELVDAINRSGARILFVALGSPRQERWIAEHASRLQVSVIQGIGGTLDTLSGHVKRAPEAWQRMNLEWLYRLLSDPRRIRRQAALPVFAWRVLVQTLAHRVPAGVGPGPTDTLH